MFIYNSICRHTNNNSWMDIMELPQKTHGFDGHGRPVVVQTILAEMLTGTERLVYDAVKDFSWGACFETVKDQQMLLDQSQVGIGHRGGHFGLFNGVQSDLVDINPV